MRSPVYAANVVATSQPLATEAGLDALRRGGNAVDAALAAAITLTVVEPVSNGIGSDAFALLWDGDTLHGLNGSGRTPRSWTRDRFAGRDRMPQAGWDSVTIPGAVDAWRRLSERFGALPFNSLFTAAIHYAERGFCVSPIIAASWSRAETRFADDAAFRRGFFPDGRSPRPGEQFRFPDQARTLAEIADSGGQSFYEGALAEQILAAAEAAGAGWSPNDLGDHRSEWVEPVAIDYGGVRLHELPPNGQGLAALIAAGVLDRLGARDLPRDSAESLHLQIEAMKIGFAEAHRHIADPDFGTVPMAALLAPSALDARAAAVDPHRAGAPAPTVFPDHGTVYLAAADAAGMIISLIQSNYMGFGSGVVVPETGISLQNRAAGFSLEPGHPNEIAGGKRPFHTIIPGFVTRNGHAELGFGVMGGPMQPQGHLQMIHRIHDHGQSVQQAADAPRWFVHDDGSVTLEDGFPEGTDTALRERGHRIMPSDDPGLFGGAQLIQKGPAGWIGGSDPRKDGMAAGF